MTQQLGENENPNVRDEQVTAAAGVSDMLYTEIRQWFGAPHGQEKGATLML